MSKVLPNKPRLSINHVLVTLIMSSMVVFMLYAATHFLITTLH